MQIRLALREEGSFWNAYLAAANTMVNAKLIGSISIGAARKNPETRAAFQGLMQTILTDAIEEVTGSPPEKWEIFSAPESERSGHA